MNITILAIESSCDETSAAVIRDGKLLSNVVASQEIHRLYGGIVPELASRAHQQNIIPVVDQSLTIANIQKTDLTAVACTTGPGLLGALLVGVSFAKTMATALNVPMIEVNHMRAHILAHFIEDPKPSFPFLCLTVSGGHTQIVLVTSPYDMTVIGQTQDDAVGEAFDKTAKLLGLPYPGGPLIDKYSAQGNPNAYTFPNIDVPGLNYSFSGIKTAILYFLKDKQKLQSDFIEKNLPDICASVQQALLDILFRKLQRAVRETGIKRVAIAGGVSANKGLRAALERKRVEESWEIFIPDFEYCTDNAAMIAMAAHFEYERNNFASWDVSPDPRMHIPLND
ncbi:MAG: tRNA (adenosine(37)-N6)-threonylcarbamoyltransferase complex transferase subunit TsaD [Cytophagaceae bacterium]